MDWDSEFSNPWARKSWPPSSKILDTCLQKRKHSTCLLVSILLRLCLDNSEEEWKTEVIKTCARSLQSCLALCGPMDCSPFQAPLSKGFSRQEYWSGLPCPSPEDHLDQGSNPRLLCLLPWQVGSLPLSYQGSPEVIKDDTKRLTCLIFFYKFHWLAISAPAEGPLAGWDLFANFFWRKKDSIVSLGSTP